MKKNVIIRPYQNGDAEKIFGMFSKFLPYQRDEQFWVWINRVLCNRNFVAVAECEGEIVGHYAVMPRTIIIEGKEYNAGMGYNAVVDPDYRQFVQIYKISKLAYKMAAEAGIPFIYAIPNASYREIQEKIEGFCMWPIFKSMERSSNADLTKNPRTIMVPIDYCYSDLFIINNFYENQQFSKVQVQNDARYWLERFLLHPQKLYQLYKIVDNGRTVGYVILKHYNKDGVKYLHIIDYLVEKDSYLEDMVNCVILESRVQNADTISVWKGNDYLQDLYLNRFGFEAKGFETSVGIKILDKSMPTELQNIICNYDNWRFVMGDSDAF